jgi:hypothetical protein
MPTTYKRFIDFTDAKEELFAKLNFRRFTPDEKKEILVTALTGLHPLYFDLEAADQKQGVVIYNQLFLTGIYELFQLGELGEIKKFFAEKYDQVPYLKQLDLGKYSIENENHKAFLEFVEKNANIPEPEPVPEAKPQGINPIKKIWKNIFGKKFEDKPE